MPPSETATQELSPPSVRGPVGLLDDNVARRVMSPAPVHGTQIVEVTDRHRWNRLVLRRPHYEVEQAWE